ncbi:hypothetical protein [Nocardiopsis rhodophaea]|uniref:hypothetical protein n=1 Tax=Nocardiopsis rhodophaea TaxID=280238 RepID=UPI0031DD750B
MPSPRDLRLLLVMKAVVAARLKGADDRHRRELLAGDEHDPDAAMEPGERAHVRVCDGQGGRVRVGTVRVDPAPVSVKVDDEAAFVAWVAERAPGEIVQAVRESYRKRVLALVKEYGQFPDPETGELVDVPGVVREEGDPKVVVNPAQGAAEALAGAHERGELPQLGAFMAEIGPGLRQVED